MTTFPPDLPPTIRLSKSSLTSFICGILGCIPFLTGLLAILFGIIGCVRTGNPLKRGRWMAITGLILGVVSLIAWSGAALVGGGVFAILKATEGPRIAAHDFMRDVSAGNDTAAKDETDSMPDVDYDATAAQIRAAGKFVDSTFLSTNITNDTAQVTGIAVFNDGTKNQPQNVSADLKNISGHWKVENLKFLSRR